MNYDIPSLLDHREIGDPPPYILEEAFLRAEAEESSTERDRRKQRGYSVWAVLIERNILSIEGLEIVLSNGELERVHGVGPKSIIFANRILRIATEIRRFQVDMSRFENLQD